MRQSHRGHLPPADDGVSFKALKPAPQAKPQVRAQVKRPVIKCTTDQRPVSLKPAAVETNKPQGAASEQSAPVESRSNHELVGTSMTTELSQFPDAGGVETLVVSTSSNRVLTRSTNHAENDRQLKQLDETYQRQKSQHQRNSYMMQAEEESGGVFSKTLSVFTDMVGLTHKAAEQHKETSIVVGETLPINMNANQAREMRCKLSMADPTLDPFYIRAFQQYVAGCQLAEMRSQGCTMKHLVGIGICYDDWTSKAGYGLREVAFMDGNWSHVVAMGFTPDHIKERDRNGPTLLRDPPFSVTWEDLEYDIGLTVDEAVFVHGFTTADFAIFGETLTELVRRGFNSKHVEAMGEPRTNFELTLNATAEDLRMIFPGRGGVQGSSSSTTNTPANSGRSFSKLTHLSTPTTHSIVPHERGA